LIWEKTKQCERPAATTNAPAELKTTMQPCSVRSRADRIYVSCPGSTVKVTVILRREA
jgi:hypothetical protein